MKLKDTQGQGKVPERIIYITSRRRDPAYPWFATNRHEFIVWKGIVQVATVSVHKHFLSLGSKNK